MKSAKFLKLVIVLFASITAKAQTNIFPDNGNAGLGTLTPTSWFSDKVLQIEGTRPTLRFAPLTEGGIGTILFKGKFSEGISGSADEFHFNYNSSSSNPFLSLGSYKNQPKTILSIFGAGRIGVGIDEPRAFLDVGRIIDSEQLGTVFGRLTEGNNEGEGTFLGVRGYNTLIAEYGGKSFALEHSFYGQRNSSLNFHRGGSILGGFITFATNDNSEKMRINANGNVGIGTITPTEKLAVNGNIRAKEIKVETDNWPDYVFSKDYQLLELQELERYIKVNKHLPDMPSASEAESNGIALGEINKLLLEKIEELTLYIIDLKKENKVINQKLETLTEKVGHDKY